MNFKQVQRPRAASQQLGIALSTLYDWTTPSSPRFIPDFPKKIKLGPRAVGFDTAEVTAWIVKKSEGGL